MERRWDAVDAYLVESTVGRDESLEAALVAASTAGLPPINVAPNQGKLLNLLARLAGARRILEIGTLGGYSTIWLARALPPDGALVTLELDPHHAEVARANCARAGVGELVDVRVGPALDSLERLRAEGGAPFDLTFIDADKANTANYFRAALELSRPGSAIVVDNVVREGRVVDATVDPNDRGVREFFALLETEPRVTATALQTVGSKGYDGFALALVVDAKS